MSRIFNKYAAVWVAVLVLVTVVGVRLGRFESLERLEWMSYDLRARASLHFPTPAATNLAFVPIEESSLKVVAHSDELGFHASTFPWPRQIYGRLVKELAAEGAQAVAFDILFGEFHPDDPAVVLPDGTTNGSDLYFAQAVQQAGNVFLAATPDVVPPAFFATNALSLGDVSTDTDSDGTLRRVRAFITIRHWHPLFEQLAQTPEISADLSRAIMPPAGQAGKIRLPQGSTTNFVEVPVDATNNFRLADFGVTPEPGQPEVAKACVEERLWHMGIVIAARALHLDLSRAQIDLSEGRIVLPGPDGLERVIPVDANGYFYLDWRMQLDDPRMSCKPIEYLLLQNRAREAGATNDLVDWARGRLVVVGSAVEGNNLTDRGATPLEHNTLLVGTHWNVANAVITGRFIRRVSLFCELGLILGLGLLTAFLTWRLRALTASLGVFLLIVAYGGFALFMFVRFRLWMPVLFPLGGAVLVQHLALVTHRVLFEEGEKRRVRGVFSKMVSPEVVNELLRQEHLSVGGSRCEVTVFFADIRGFTTLTDQMQEQVAEHVRQRGLEGAAAEECFNEFAAETLHTVNIYLAAVAEAVIKHNGTLDKYIGDCVMAYWNAPLPNPRHACDAVLTAVDAQRAIVELNRRRVAENPEREALNARRQAEGKPPLPLHSPLQLGTGINTGLVVAGIMGSEVHGISFTVFGREVNLASRLEGVSGSGRIIISEATYGQIQRLDPALAGRCVALPPVSVKGIREAVKIYEVRWQEGAAGTVSQGG